MATATLPDRAHVVIVGGGVIGTSVAYHLAGLGLDRRRAARAGPAVLRHDLARGRTGRPAARDRERTRLVQYSTRALRRLEAETGVGTGCKQCGGVTVARTPERMVQLQRTAATAAAYELECELITARARPPSITR